MLRLMLFFAMGVLLASAPNAASGSSQAAPLWVVRDLGTLGGEVSSATAINPSGQVVGTSFTADSQWHAFSWAQGARMVDLGTLGNPFVASYAVGVNANGQVVGYASPVGTNDPQHGFFWSQATGSIDLGTIAGDTIVQPVAINASGQIVGYSWAAGTAAHAFSWTQAGRMIDLGGGHANDVSDGGEVVGMGVFSHRVHACRWTQSGGSVDLGTLGGTASEAMAINERGQIVGWSYTPAQLTHAFLLSPGSGMFDLGTLGGSTSNAVAISENGQVIGSSTTAAGTEHAFTWTQAGGMVDLGTLGGGTSTPTDVSASGQVVGYSTNASGAERAFLWQDGKMIDLGTAGGPQARAVAINDQDQIVGYSFTTGGWGHRSLLWSPAEVKPVIGAPVTTPKVAVAGKRFTLAFEVTRSDTGAPLTTGKMMCDPSIAGKVIRHAESFKAGIAKLSFVIPKAAKGKLLKVKLTIRSGTQSATKIATFHVR